MFDKWLKLPAHYYLRITALVILTVGICLHNTLMSIGAIWIMANWLIEADYKFYWKKFKTTPTVWMLLGILFLGLLSLLWSDDVGYGLKDLGRKMPFFAIPFALGLGKPVEKKVVYFLLYIFIGILLLTSGINYYRYNYVLEDAQDIREMSYFIHHVRFSVLTALGVFAATYLAIKNKGPYFLWLFTILWLGAYTLVSGVLAGYLILFVLGAYTFIHFFQQIKKLHYKVASVVLLTILLVIAGVYTYRTLDSYTAPAEVDLAELDEFSPSGRPYYHALERTQRENGNLIWINVQQEELENEWNRRSQIPYDFLDRKEQPMFGTLMRYMTSKGIKKDSVGVWSLTDAEVLAIENGSTTAHNRTGFDAKMSEFLHQWHVYTQGGDPNGHSLLQRMEHQRIAWMVVGDVWFLGAGMGDVPDVFNQKYEDSGSLLTEQNRHRSHNQFLTIWISHGILGLFMFVGMLIIPLWKRKEKDYFFYVVILTLFISCLFQDLIETQAGVTIFGLFYGLTVYKEDESLSSDMSVSEGSE